MRAAIELKPENMEIEIFEIAEIPPFNQDFEKQPPQIVKDLKAKIKESMVGRKRVYELYPVSLMEFVHFKTAYRYEGNLLDFFSSYLTTLFYA